MNLDHVLRNFEGIHLQCYQNLGLEGCFDADDWEINLMKEAFKIGFEMNIPEEYDRGYTDGHSDGYDQGIDEGYNDGYEDATDKYKCDCEDCELMI